MPTFNTKVKVNGNDMALYGNRPEGDSGFPGIVVIQHAPGVDEFIHNMVNRLADAGYCAVAPDLYHRIEQPGLEPLQKMKMLKDQEVISDVNATVEYLRKAPEVDSDSLGITGFCMGGRVVYLMSAVNPHFKAAVVYYGGNIKQAWGEGVASPFEHTKEINCPLLFHFGEDDTNPSLQDRQAYDEELTRYNKVHEFYSYPNAGHAFMNFTSAERYREAAANDSWPRTLAFFERYLRK